MYDKCVRTLHAIPGPIVRHTGGQSIRIQGERDTSHTLAAFEMTPTLAKIAMRRDGAGGPTGRGTGLRLRGERAKVWP